MTPPEHDINLLWETLERIRAIWPLSEREFAERMGLKTSDYLRLRLQKKSPSASSIFDLIDGLPLTYENVVTGRIDYVALEDHLRGGLGLSERFSKCARSRLRTSLIYLHYIEARFGWGARRRLLNQMQLKESLFEDPDLRVSIRLNIELNTYLSRLGLRAADFYEIGGLSHLLNRKSGLGERLATCREPLELYSLMFEDLVKRFEENGTYRIERVDGTKAYVSYRPSQEVQEALGMERVGNPNLCITRSGTGATFTHYLGLPGAHVREVKCVHMGDDHCVHEFDFTQAGEVAKIRRLRGPSLVPSPELLR